MTPSKKGGFITTLCTNVTTFGPTPGRHPFWGPKKEAFEPLQKGPIYYCTLQGKVGGWHTCTLIGGHTNMLDS